MGHGLGQQQREILAILKRRRRNPSMTTSELAEALGGDTPSRRESVRQALHALHRRGLVDLQHLPDDHDLSDARLDQLGRYGVAARPVHLVASLPRRL
jgi:hypothetical protein